MLYSDYLKKISSRFNSIFDEIDPRWNFDYGSEFEVALASLLDEMLPDKYGVCRGFVVSQNGDTAGDDIIIYDRLSSPVLRPPTPYKFARREEIPIEAVYAYIEVKNTLEIGKNKDKGTHILKAINQVNSVKNIVSTRETRGLNKFIDGIEADTEVRRSKNAPQTYNPLWTMIVSRGIRINGKVETNHQKIDRALSEIECWEGGADLIVMDKDTVSVPLTKEHNYTSTFSMENNQYFSSKIMDGYAFGFGLASLIRSLELIRLNPVPWSTILKDGFENSSNVIQ